MHEAFCWAFHDKSLKAGLEKVGTDLATDTLKEGKDAAFKALGELSEGTGPALALLMGAL